MASEGPIRILGGGTAVPAPAMFPAALRTPSGYVVAFSTVPDGWAGGEVRVARSSDGVSWDPSQTVAAPRGEETAVLSAVGMARLADGTILLPVNAVTWYPGEGTAGRRIALRLVRSYDDGATWDAGEPVSVDFAWPAVYGEILEFDDGELLWPIWGRMRLDEKWRSAVLTSRDAGRTWTVKATIAFDPGARMRGDYVESGNDEQLGVEAEFDDVAFRPHDPTDGFNETSVCRLADGRLLAILRQQGVDGDSGLRFYRAVSADRGATWSRFERLGFSGMSPALTSLPDGRVVLVSRRHVPLGSSVEPAVEARVGDVEGRNWSAPTALEDPLGGRLTEEYQCGYPAIVHEDGALRVFFYSFAPDEGRYIAWNRLDVSRPETGS